MHRMIKLLAGMALGAVMVVSLSGTAKAQTYLLSQILAEAHQGENAAAYYFEGGEEISNPVTYPPTGKGPYFAPGDRIVSDLPGAYLLAANSELILQGEEKAVSMFSDLGQNEDQGAMPKSYRGESIQVHYSADGTAAAYQIHLRPALDAEPNAELYYAVKAALRDPARIGYVFDAAYYAANNPDVAAAFGTDPALLWQHYATAGYIEGRKAHPENAIQMPAQTTIPARVPGKVYSEAEVIAIYEGTLRAAGMVKPEEIYSADQISRHGRDAGMGWAIADIPMDDPHGLAGRDVVSLQLSGYGLYYLESLGSSDGYVHLKVYRGTHRD